MWHHERDPVRLVHLARQRRLPPRAFLLFSVSCCRLVEHLIPVELWREVLRQSERFAEGELDELNWDCLPEWHTQTAFVARNVAFAFYSLYPYSFGAMPNLAGAAHHALAVPGFVAHALAAAAAGPVEEGYAPDHPWHARWLAARRAALEWQSDLGRCVFGPPDALPFARHWRTRDVGELSDAAHETRDLALYPLLHDALIEAGCDDAGVLGHCRTVRHARGCWALAAVRAAGVS